MSRFARRLQKATTPVTGARLYITPASGSYATGATITITIREDSHSTAVNAVQADLTYPTARLQFQSISTSTSAFTTTLQNTGGSGTVQIGVGNLGSSVTGNQIVATVTFTALSAGNAAIAFANTSGIADAATSSDVCNQKDSASFTLS